MSWRVTWHMVVRYYRWSNNDKKKKPLSHTTTVLSKFRFRRRKWGRLWLGMVTCFHLKLNLYSLLGAFSVAGNFVSTEFPLFVLPPLHINTMPLFHLGLSPKRNYVIILSNYFDFCSSDCVSDYELCNKFLWENFMQVGYLSVCKP